MSRLSIQNVAFGPNAVLIELSDGDELEVAVGDTIDVGAGMLVAGALCLANRVTNMEPGKEVETRTKLMNVLIEKMVERATELLGLQSSPATTETKPTLSVMKGGKDEPT
jgi:hypothetical protein